jgi:outer membrane protein OmpA-like peptidoglycan-associated protein
MHMPLFKKISLMLAAGLLGACGNISHKIAADGSRAGELAWPSPQDVIALHRGGSYPAPAQLRQIQPGMNKRQIIGLIGAPHFNEGLFKVREWDYLFNLRAHHGGATTVCQYKILFDEQQLARSFYWRPESCAALLRPPHRPHRGDHSPAPSTQVTVLSADALFVFDKGDAAGIRPQGKIQLAALASKIAAAGEAVGKVVVAGYTDRLGKAAYNEALSQRRARTVRQYLVSHGVAQALVSAEGKGEADPLVACDTDHGAALVTCLAPNRRVMVTVTDTRGSASH